MTTPSLVRSENNPAFVYARTMKNTFEPAETLLVDIPAFVFRFAFLNGITSVN